MVAWSCCGHFNPCLPHLVLKTVRTQSSMAVEPPGVGTNQTGVKFLCVTSRLVLLENVYIMFFAPCHGSYALNGWYSGPESHPGRYNTDRGCSKLQQSSGSSAGGHVLLPQTGRVSHIVQCWAIPFYDLLWGIVPNCQVLTWSCQQFWELYNGLLVHSFLLTPKFWFL